MTRYPLYKGLGGPVWTGAENLASTGIRSPDLPVPIDYANPPTHRVHIPDEVRAWELNNETLLRQEQAAYEFVHDVVCLGTGS